MDSDDIDTCRLMIKRTTDNRWTEYESVGDDFNRFRNNKKDALQVTIVRIEHGRSYF